MSQEVGAQLFHCRTALDLWTSARTLTSASSRSRVLIYQSELHHTRKNGMRMDEYLAKMRNILDQLILAGAAISTDELILHTLNGLDGDYNAIVVKLIDQSDLTWVETQAALLAFESHLEQLNLFSTMSIQPSANVATRESSVSAHPFYFGGRTSYRGVFRGSRGFRGRRSRGGRSNHQDGSNRPYCNYCYRYGHYIHTCYQRQDNATSRGSAPHNHSPQAFYADPHVVSDPEWYMDSGASHHVISNSAHLDSTAPTGNMSLYTCTGKKAKIHGIGSAFLSCPTSNLKFNEVLVVSSTTKNLLSVNRLIKDNSVSIIFTNDGCLVKEKGIGQVLLKGMPRQGLYPMTKITSPITINMASTVKKDDDLLLQWHRRLGHPSQKVLNKILQECNVDFRLNENFVCYACQYGKSKRLPFPVSHSHASAPLELIHFGSKWEGRAQSSPHSRNGFNLIGSSTFAIEILDRGFSKCSLHY
ncbi:hypothetical protein QN277_014520 [Acacia crassicarpa]|uniref:GAG-pre-integrase domain-containing protein n=1 Tax=Acacia crassicarpa TaxID=499986 RepID=A0AAE1M477_9FABA|nr:hypothetical protein QN277_014520 [Acacia crassicarpa]